MAPDNYEWQQPNISGDNQLSLVTAKYQLYQAVISFLCTIQLSMAPDNYQWRQPTVTSNSQLPIVPGSYKFLMYQPAISSPSQL